MAANSILNGDDSEQRWVDQISKNFDDEVAIGQTDVPTVCVFNVPKSISYIKPEAYVPQAIALGPYHHFEPHLYQMERYKVAAVKKLLNHEQVLTFKSLVIDKLKEMEPTVRSCYHKYLDLDEETLAWILAIDGLFLLDLLSHYADVESLLPKKFMNDAILVRDVMVLENQIPLVVLQEILKILCLYSSEAELFSMMKGFCEVHSPLRLARDLDYSVETKYLHLLDLMYNLIVENHVSEQESQAVLLPEEEEEDDDDVEQMKKNDHVIENLEKVVELGLDLGAGKKINKPIKVIKNVPWEKISNLLGLKIGENSGDEGQGEKNPHIEEIDVPSVSSLHKYGGINFSHTIGGIRDIKFVESEATLYLPVITLNVYSEVVLRNLVAYEVATSNPTLELARYVDLMSGIIDAEADARLLKAKGIIKGSMTIKEITRLFNSMNKSKGAYASSNDTIEKINNYYSNRLAIKAWRFVKKRVHDSQKVMKIILTIVVCLFMILYSVCQVYGCPSFFNSAH